VIPCLLVAGCHGAAESAPQATFALHTGESASHYGAKLTLVSGGRAIETAGETTFIKVRVERDGKLQELNVLSSSFGQMESTLGVSWRVDKADGFDPKEATITVFKPGEN
jgi:hypothetical protein